MGAILTREVAKNAEPIIRGVFYTMYEAGLLGDRPPHLYLVTLDPTIAIPGQFSASLARDAILHEIVIGEPSEWLLPFNMIGHSKSHLSWRYNLPTRVIRECYPHLLDDGDTQFGGSSIDAGLISAASGQEPWFDEMLAGIANKIYIGRSNERMQRYVIPDRDMVFIASRMLPQV